MLEQINKENFQHMLGQFSTPELEGMIEKFPYFQQAHLLLAKKYQQENNPKFDQQLQLAALYIQDRELLYSLFNEKNIVATPEVNITAKVEKKVDEVVTTSAAPPEVATISVAEVVETSIPKQQATEEVKPEETDLELQMQLLQESLKEINKIAEKTTEEKLEIAVELQQTEIEVEKDETHVEPVSEEIKEPEEDTKVVFSRIQPHTFDEWLEAFNNKKPVETEEKPVATEDKAHEEDELSELIATNVSVDYLHELVKEETTYAKGLEQFIEEQIQKHKLPEVKKASPEIDLSTEPATETMAKVYEMQKKYAKAIKIYDALILKYPEKTNYFTARINYLKNII
jgi:hypothetical protein